MRNAILLHGLYSEDEFFDPAQPSPSNAHWLPWLQCQLQLAGIHADTPEVPESYRADWETWSHEVERYDIGPETMLIGHSCGAGFWVRYLSEHPELHVGKVVLVAPWLDPQHDEAGDFFEFEIDPQLAARTQGVTIFHSDNDMGNVHKSVALLRETVENIQYREFSAYGHFCYNDMGTVEFPELRDALIG